MIVIRNYGFGPSNVLSEATALWQAKNYEGAGLWLDEVGSANFQHGSVAGAYIGPTSFGAGNALILPGVSGNYASSPDSAALDITGDMAVVAHVSATDYSSGGTQVVVSKYSTTGNQRGFQVGFLASGEMFFTVSNDGTTIVSNSGLTPCGVTNGTASWFAWSLDVNNGAGGRTAQFWKSSDGSSWTLVETLTTGATTAIYSNTASVNIGSNTDGVNGLFTGSIGRAQIYSGVRDFSGTPSGGTLVFDADFTAQATGTTSFTEDSSNAATVTVVSTGADTNDPLFLPYSTSQNPFGAGVDYVYHPALTTVSQHISVADNATFDTTGDIDLRVWCCPTSWANGLSQSLINRDNIGTNPNRCWALALNATGSLSLQWFPLGTSASSVVASSTALVTTVFATGQAGWVRVTLDVDNGSGGYDVKFYTSTDGSNWTQLGTTVTGGSTTNLVASNEPLWVGARRASGSFIFQLEGKIARAQFYHGIDGTLVADFNPSGGTISSTHSTLTGTGDGLTWTFNRASTGRKLAVVDEDKFLLGTDDYFTTPDNSNLEFGTGTDWSAVFVGREFDNSGHFGLTKRVQDSNNYGWQVRITGTNNEIATIEKDSSGTSYDDDAPRLTYTLGERVIISGVVNRASQTIQSYANTTPGTTKTSVTARNTDTGAALDYGRAAGSSTYSYANCEVIAAAIFKGKALTASEVAQVVSELAA